MKPYYPVRKKDFDKVLGALLVSSPLTLAQASRGVWEKRGLGALHDLDITYREKVKTAKGQAKKLSSDLEAIQEAKRLLRSRKGGATDEL